MRYRTIKYVLRQHLKNKVKTKWTWDKGTKEFTCIYSYNPKGLKTYSPKQLLKEIENEIQLQKV